MDIAAAIALGDNGPGSHLATGDPTHLCLQLASFSPSGRACSTSGLKASCCSARSPASRWRPSPEVRSPGWPAQSSSVCLLGLMFAIFTVSIKANQIVVGAALNMVGLGLTGFLYRTLFDISTKASKPSARGDPGPEQHSDHRRRLLPAEPIRCTPRSSSCRWPHFCSIAAASGSRCAPWANTRMAADTVGISVSRIRYASCAWALRSRPSAALS